MALREESFVDTAWSQRCDRVKQAILAADADIVCLQELRALTVNGTMQQPEAFLASIEGYRFVLQYRSPNHSSFGQAILYKTHRFFELNTIKRWLSSTPTVYSESWPSPTTPHHLRASIVTGLHLGVCPPAALDSGLHADYASFWVFNTHFNCEETVKTKSCDALIGIVEQTIEPNQPFLVCGDFNFFPDKVGPMQRGILMETGGYQDLGQNAVSSQTNTRLEATFVGYLHDTGRARDPFTSQSRLDHVFGSAHWHVQSSPILYTETFIDGVDGHAPELSAPNMLPSDHLPLLVSLGPSPPAAVAQSSSASAMAITEEAAPVNICTICNDAPLNRTIVPCGHAACQSCIDTWMKRNKTCPFCRADISMTIPRYNN